MNERNVEKKNRLYAEVFSVGSLLLGTALAAPLRMTLYFSEKPSIDILIDLLLIVAIIFIALRWIKEKGKWLIYLIPLLSLFWMPFEYMAYSKSEWFSVISYLLIVWWSSSMVVLYRFGCSLYQDKRKPLWGLVAFLAGFTVGLFTDSVTYTFVPCSLFIVLVGFNAPPIGRKLIPEGLVTFLILLLMLIAPFLPELKYFESQKRHHDKVVFSQDTRFQRLDVTEWKGNYWFYQDDINHFSSIDSWLYYEPFVHPAMHLASAQPRVLIIGGENGMLANALQQYDISSIDMLPIDWEYLEIAESNPYFTRQNGEVFSRLSINVIPHSPFRWLNKAKAAYDMIFVDVPDPIDIELNQYYTQEFYQLAHQALTTEGVIITQSGSPYFATAAFQSIEQTMKSAEYFVASFHNQVLSLGEWGWTLGSKSGSDPNKKLRELTFEGIETQWLNQEAMQMMLSFGKPYVSGAEVQINTIQNPVIHSLYRQGNYQLN